MPRPHDYILFLLGLTGGLATAQYSTGRDISYVRGQLKELVKIEHRVAHLEARLDAIDFEISDMESGRWMRQAQ